MFLQNCTLKFHTSHSIADLPKSANLSSPISLMSKFCGLTSRCNILLRWQYESPRKSWNMKSFTFRGFKPPGCDSRYWDKSVCWKKKCINFSKKQCALCCQRKFAFHFSWKKILQNWCIEFLTAFSLFSKEIEAYCASFALH